MNRSPQKSSQELDVVERGGYSEAGDGPVSDTVGFQQATPPGVDRRPMAKGEARAEGGFLSRERLARNTGPRESRERFELEPWHGILAAALVALIAGAAFALWLASGGTMDLAPEAPQVVEDKPTEIDGVPVQRGMRR